MSILQDPTAQAEIDNFMVQQLDGTKNEWGWCKQKVFTCHMLVCTIAEKNNHDFPFGS
jgi:enolase